MNSFQELKVEEKLQLEDSLNNRELEKKCNFFRSNSFQESSKEKTMPHQLDINEVSTFHNKFLETNFLPMQNNISQLVSNQNGIINNNSLEIENQENINNFQKLNPPIDQFSKNEPLLEKNQEIYKEIRVKKENQEEMDKIMEFYANNLHSKKKQNQSQISDSEYSSNISSDDENVGFEDFSKILNKSSLSDRQLRKLRDYEFKYLSIPDLKILLEKRNLTKGGNKDDLIVKLRTYLHSKKIKKQKLKEKTLDELKNLLLKNPSEKKTELIKKIISKRKN